MSDPENHNESDGPSSDLVDLTAPTPERDLEDMVGGIPYTLPDGRQSVTMGVGRTNTEGIKEMLVREVPESDGPTEAIWVAVPDSKERTSYMQPTGLAPQEDIAAKAIAMDRAEVKSGIPADIQDLYEYGQTSPFFCTDQSARVDAWGNITAQDFITHLTLIHKLVAPEIDQSPQEKPASLYRDNNGVKVKTDELMNPDDRLRFIEDTLEQVRSLLQEVDNQDTQSQKAALIRISNAIALATVITHTFEDGNGRTARTLSLLIRDGVPVAQENIEQLQLVSSNRPTDGKSRRITSFTPAYRSDDPEEIWQKSVESAIGRDLPLTEEGQERYERAKEFMSPFIDTLDVN